MLHRLAAVALFVSATTAAGFAQTDRETHVFSLPPDRRISVNVTIGAIRVIASDRRDAAIELSRTAPTAAGLARIPVNLQETADEVRIESVQPDGDTDPRFRTDITLRVPRRAVIKALHVIEGSLVVSGLHGEITADIRRGGIEANDVQGTVRLETGIGTITATRMALVRNGLLRLRTFNGDVRLTLAQRPVDARILVLALNGTIRSDIALQTKEAWGPRWGEATLGVGEPVISIDVVTGTVDIKAAG